MSECDSKCPCPDDDLRDKQCDSYLHNIDGDMTVHTLLREGEIFCLWGSTAHFWFRTKDELKYGRPIE